MSTPEDKRDLAVAEMAVALVETRIRERMHAAPYCDQGVNAYNQAEHAVRNAFKDVRRVFHKLHQEIDKREGGP